VTPILFTIIFYKRLKAKVNMKVINPATLQVLKEISENTSEEITQKFHSAQKAQGEWGRKTLEERLAIIARFYDLLESHKDELARDLSLEVGKPLQEAFNELNGARGRIKFFLENSSKHLNTQELNWDGKTRDVLDFDPLGVVCNISAWNYPYLVGVNVFIPALIGGNAVLYKPSEFALLTGQHIERLMHQAGVPKEIFQAVLGGPKAGEVLLDLPCDGYFFTGSYKTGNFIATKVASKLVPVGLELGGKDPLYVTEDCADLKNVAANVAEGCFYNNGQSCCAVERVYVHEKVFDTFIQHFVEETNKLKIGSDLGAVTRPSHLDFLDSQVQDAVKKGAQVLTGGKRTGEGSFYLPTVLINVSHKMSVMKEETFGPVVGVMKVKDDSQAIELMNDTAYGLTASVYSQNVERAKKILAQVDAGTSYINCCDRVSPYLPWAGRGHSGLGATLSYLGILAFVKPRGWHIRN
jgi:acyl-CoA reductase-like NAD-dependent aldehyde dehydrogenase